MKVGIPRTLFFYKFYPFWKKFFEELGFDVIISEPTNKEILDLSVRYAPSEACLPVKLAYGHSWSLKNKVDMLFIPRIVSIEQKAYMCPKFLGLPDILRNSKIDLPFILDVEIDRRSDPFSSFDAFLKLGKSLVKDRRKVLHAYFSARKDLKEYERLLHEGNRLDYLIEGEKYKERNDHQTLNIGVIGHSYNIYDRFINNSLLDNLSKLGVNIYMMEEVNWNKILKEANVLPKKLFWTLGKELYGGVRYFTNNKCIDGLILVFAFGCGPDSLVRELIEQDLIKPGRIPTLSLVLDEHTAEVGLLTRLEAFVDMLQRRKKVEDNKPIIW